MQLFPCLFLIISTTGNVLSAVNQYCGGRIDTTFERSGSITHFSASEADSNSFNGITADPEDKQSNHICKWIIDASLKQIVQLEVVSVDEKSTLKVWFENTVQPRAQGRVGCSLSGTGRTAVEFRCNRYPCALHIRWDVFEEESRSLEAQISSTFFDAASVPPSPNREEIPTQGNGVGTPNIPETDRVLRGADALRLGGGVSGVGDKTGPLHQQENKHNEEEMAGALLYHPSLCVTHPDILSLPNAPTDVEISDAESLSKNTHTDTLPILTSGQETHRPTSPNQRTTVTRQNTHVKRHTENTPHPDAITNEPRSDDLTDTNTGNYVHTVTHTTLDNHSASSTVSHTLHSRSRLSEHTPQSPQNSLSTRHNTHTVTPRGDVTMAMTFDWTTDGTVSRVQTNRRLAGTFTTATNRRVTRSTVNLLSVSKATETERSSQSLTSPHPDPGITKRISTSADHLDVLTRTHATGSVLTNVTNHTPSLSFSVLSRLNHPGLSGSPSLTSSLNPSLTESPFPSDEGSRTEQEHAISSEHETRKDDSTSAFSYMSFSPTVHTPVTSISPNGRGSTHTTVSTHSPNTHQSHSLSTLLTVSPSGSPTSIGESTPYVTHPSSHSATPSVLSPSGVSITPESVGNSSQKFPDGLHPTVATDTQFTSTNNSHMSTVSTSSPTAAYFSTAHPQATSDLSPDRVTLPTTLTDADGSSSPEGQTIHSSSQDVQTRRQSPNDYQTTTSSLKDIQTQTHSPKTTLMHVDHPTHSGSNTDALTETQPPTQRPVFKANSSSTDQKPPQPNHSETDRTISHVDQYGGTTTAETPITSLSITPGYSIQTGSTRNINDRLSNPTTVDKAFPITTTTLSPTASPIYTPSGGAVTTSQTITTAQISETQTSLKSTLQNGLTDTPTTQNQLATSAVHHNTYRPTLTPRVRTRPPQTDSYSYSSEPKTPSSQPVTPRLHPSSATHDADWLQKRRVFIVEDQPVLIKEEGFQLLLQVFLQQDAVAEADLQHVEPFLQRVAGYQHQHVIWSRGAALQAVVEFRTAQALSWIGRAEPLLQEAGLTQALREGLYVGGVRVKNITVGGLQADVCSWLFMCPSGFQCVSVEGNASCSSLCHLDYCKHQGICMHRRGQQPVCQCPAGEDFWYMGPRCDVRMTRQRLVGVCFGVLVAVAMLMALLSYMAVRRFKRILIQAKVDQTRSSYRKFNHFDELSARFWARSWPGSDDSLDNPAFTRSDELLHLRALDRTCCYHDDTLSIASTYPGSAMHLNTVYPHSSQYGWDISNCSLADGVVDSGKASDLSVCSWPIEPIQWTPFPLLQQLKTHSTVKAPRPRSYCEGMELVDLEKSWTA